MYSANPLNTQKRKHNVSERNRIVIENMPLIKKMAKSMHIKFGRHMDYEEIVNIGILEALKRSFKKEGK